MRSLNSIGLGLSLTFGCLLVALMGEIYYLLWWKRRSWNRGISEDDCCISTSSSAAARDLMYMFCCKKMSTQPLSNSSSTTEMSLTVRDSFHQQQNETQNRSNNIKDLLMLKSDGPPRLLFTINEETREDLESEDGKSARSLSGLVVVQNSTIIDVETPYLTPLSSPSMLAPLNSSYTTHVGFKFNPLFESSSDAELSRLKASPPPKFKFLQEAEDKFQRRRMMEEAEHVSFKDHLNDIECAENIESATPENRFTGDESFITIIVAKGSRGGQLV